VAVLVLLAMALLVAARFAQRIDDLRGQARTLIDETRAEVEGASARAATLFWLATRRAGATGYGEAEQQVRVDGRPYRWPGGAEVRVQDSRGLISVNVVNRAALNRLLVASGIEAQKADAMIDVLLDYADADSLKRLNGAEADAYRALGLPPPRDDWLRSLRDLRSMPLWRDDPARLARLEPLLTISRDGTLNPNAAPRAVLEAWFPTATREQIDLFLTLREASPFYSAGAAERATGLPFGGQDYFLLASTHLELMVLADGAARARYYNLELTPDGSEAPWLVREARSAAPRPPPDPLQRGLPFPLVVPSVRP
jgi:type II secretory pathway component PulK